MLRRRAEQGRLDLRAANFRVLEERDAVASADARIADLEEALSVLQGVAAAVQTQVHGRISAIVTKCLSAIFEDPYSFEIIFEQKRGKTEARLVFRRNGNEVDPLAGSGLGVVDVAAFALRLANLMLSRPPRRRLLVLDEPWKHLSAGHRPAMRLLIEELAKEMGVQFVIVTHSDEFRMGKVVEFEGE